MSYLKSLFSLDNKISIVTGSARGNGKAIAEALLRSGSIVIMVDVLKKELLQTEKEFLSENLPAVSYVCDITKKDQILKLGKYIGKKKYYLFKMKIKYILERLILYQVELIQILVVF